LFLQCSSSCYTKVHLSYSLPYRTNFWFVKTKKGTNRRKIYYKILSINSVNKLSKNHDSLTFLGETRTTINPIMGPNKQHQVNAFAKLIFFSLAKSATKRERPNQDIQINIVSMLKQYLKNKSNVVNSYIFYFTNLTFIYFYKQNPSRVRLLKPYKIYRPKE
jgi:hypothetical protein